MASGEPIPTPAREEPRAREEHEPSEHEIGILTIFREWADALVFAFVLAMFVRVFVVELFKIPTGSMTPTLIGDRIAEVDVDNDSLVDLVVTGGSGPIVFLNKGDRYEAAENTGVTSADVVQWERDGIVKPQYDRILVNKFSYWFQPPARGDVVVFKVPESIWDPNKPIFIKRAVGLPGERIAFDGPLSVNGVVETQPEFFRHQKYKSEVRSSSDVRILEYVEYSGAFARTEIEAVTVPEDSIYVLGDNTNNSQDSRYWGAVPIDNVKGKAFIRYWPLNKFKFIE